MVKANSHGGVRKGAGRKKGTTAAALLARKLAEEAKVIAQSARLPTDPQTPASFLLAVALDEQQDPRIRVDAAKALLPYYHQKLPPAPPAKDDAADNPADDWSGLLN